MHANNSNSYTTTTVRSTTNSSQVLRIESSHSLNIQDATIATAKSAPANHQLETRQHNQISQIPATARQISSLHAEIDSSYYSPSLTRIRRLKRMYRFWEPIESTNRVDSNSNNHNNQTSGSRLGGGGGGEPNSTTMTRDSPPPNTDATASQRSSAATTDLSSQSSNQCTAILMDEPTVIIANHSDSVAVAAAKSGGGKLWQSLVMPIVLGCVIFLIALWTRQLSLVLLNETIAMIFILAAVFITMSGLAFWLAQDHQSSELATDGNSDTLDSNSETTTRAGCRSGSIGSASSLSSSTHNCRYCSSHHHQHHSQIAAGAQSPKCCDLAIIDCKPPDYWVALLESSPIQYEAHSSSSIEQHQQHPQQHNRSLFADSYCRNSGKDLILRIDLPTSTTGSCSPPSYDDLVTGR